MSVISEVRFQILRGSNLFDTEVLGEMDPYVVVRMGKLKFTSKVKTGAMHRCMLDFTRHRKSEGFPGV